MKRKKADLERRIKLALAAIPGFCPRGWSAETPSATVAGVQIVPQDETLINFDQPCVICDSLDDDDKCLICDNCCVNLHYFCIALTSVPDGAWICPWCAQGIRLDTEQVISSNLQKNLENLQTN